MTDFQYLTLDFVNNESIVLQYHPNSLSLQQETPTNTTLGLNNLITHLANPDTCVTAISLQATFTALDAPTKNAGFRPEELGFILAAGNSLAFTSLQEDMFNITQSLSNSISVAKGTIDLVSGLVQSSSQIKKRIGFSEKRLGYIKNLRDYNAKATPCRINWDVEKGSVNDDRYYFIKSMDINVLDIQEETGETLAFNLDLTFSQYGKTNVKLL